MAIDHCSDGGRPQSGGGQQFSEFRFAPDGRYQPLTSPTRLPLLGVNHAFAAFHCTSGYLQRVGEFGETTCY